MSFNCNFQKKEKKKSKDNHERIVFLRVCDITASNFGNLASYLQTKQRIFNILLPYYSVLGILNALLPKFFVNLSSTKITVLSYWGVVISLTFLVISMQLTIANYNKKIQQATNILNRLKCLKHEVQYSKKETKVLWEEYKEIILDVDISSRRIFLKTCKEKDRKASIKSQCNQSIPEVKKHFSRAEVIYLQILNILESLLFVLVFSFPVVFYILIFTLSF